jgi:non-ribosomal peptide synthetase component F
MDTSVLGTLRQERNPDSEIGVDFAVGVQYRPLFNQNIVINASGSLLQTGEGLDNLYGKDPGVLYSTFINAILSF